MLLAPGVDLLNSEVYVCVYVCVHMCAYVCVSVSVWVWK